MKPEMSKQHLEKSENEDGIANPIPLGHYAVSVVTQSDVNT